jgi:hypothetical protein
MDWRAVKIVAGAIAGIWVLLVGTAVAIPVFLGARDRANARVSSAAAAQHLRPITGGDEAVGAAAAIVPKDLSSKWTFLGRTIVPASQLQRPDPTCPAKPPELQHATSEVVMEYSRDLTRGGAETGHLTSSVLTFPTADEASTAFAFFQTPEYQVCEQQRVEQVLSDPPLNLGVRGLQSTAFGVDSVPDALALRVRAQAVSSTGSRQLTIDTIRFNVGRTIGVLRYSWCPCSSAAGNAKTESSNAHTVASRLASDVRTRAA